MPNSKSLDDQFHHHYQTQMQAISMKFRLGEETLKTHLGCILKLF